MQKFCVKKTKTLTINASNVVREQLMIINIDKENQTLFEGKLQSMNFDNLIYRIFKS